MDIGNLSERAGTAYGPDSDDDAMKFGEDDELYSSGADEDDARWIRKQHGPASEREKHEAPESGDSTNQPEADDDSGSEGDQDTADTRKHTGGKKRGVGTAPALESDAQLSCPLCFTTVCLQCQQHARYHTQFRAVTAVNVVVNDDVVLTEDDICAGRHKPNRGRKGRGRGGRRALPDDRDQGADKGDEVFHPVHCRECGHRVGALDEEEVFHFFDVIASG